MPKTLLQIGNLSDIGKKRSVNEDYYGSFTGKFGHLIIVCDGMGGHKGGATASRIATETIKLHFEQLPEKFNPQEELKNAFIKANNNILQKALESDELKGMGSTAVVLLIRNNTAYYAHIGDSRIYLVRGNDIHQLTKDHSLVQQLVDAGIINAEAAKSHPQKNVITRSLGADGKHQPDIAEPISLFRNDIFILCTDGLTEYLSKEEIKEFVTQYDPQTACNKMVALANERGGKDNITVQVVKVISGKKLPLKVPIKIREYQLPIFIGFALALLFTFYLILGLPNPFKKELKPIIIADTSAQTFVPKDTLILADSIVTQTKMDTIITKDTLATTKDTLTSRKDTAQKAKELVKQKSKQTKKKNNR